jgi:hypothetical protein
MMQYPYIYGKNSDAMERLRSENVPPASALSLELRHLSKPPDNWRKEWKGWRQSRADFHSR